MLYAGLDLSRKRVDVCLLDERGERVAVTWRREHARGSMVARVVFHPAAVSYTAPRSRNRTTGWATASPGR